METFILTILTYFFLMLLSAFFSGSETAFFSLSPSEIAQYRKDNRKSKKIISDLLRKPRQLLIVILTGNLFINILLSTISNDLSMQLFGNYGPMATVLLLTPLIIIFAEILPKNIALSYKDALSTITAYPIYYFSLLIHPLKILFHFITNTIFRLLRFRESEENLSRDELASSVKLGQKFGIIARAESTFLLNLLKMEHREAQHIMIPRNETFFISIDASFSEAKKLFKESKVSSLPVYYQNRDQIKGFLFLKDIAVHVHDLNPPKKIRRLIRPAHFFPYRMELFDLLREFRRIGIRVAVLLDEHGGTAGIVTLKDIISHLLGFDPNFDPNNKIQKVTRSTFRLPGDLLIDDFNDFFSETLESTQAETINGYILEKFGKIPKPGDTLINGKSRFIIVKMDENRIEEILFRGKNKRKT